jgi:hypothetical protein
LGAKIIKFHPFWSNSVLENFSFSSECLVWQEFEDDYQVGKSSNFSFSDQTIFEEISVSPQNA